MIDIKDKQDCVGCNACVQVCPKSCIDLQEDEQGFCYPTVDLLKCIDCHLCERVCPVINIMPVRKPLASFAVRNINCEEVEKSSSGGAFYALAEEVVREGGVVFGARFDKNWNVVHGYTETIAGISDFQGSKYAQSKIGESFRKAESFLKEGRRVMFTGTPCQLAALQLYLRHDYGDRLLKIDVVCHGVPSQGSWRSFLQYVTHGSTVDVLKINFRDKRRGWENYGFSVGLVDSHSRKNEKYIPSEKNIFMEAFLRNFNIRPSCFCCPAKKGKSQSDLTLGDFWGIRTTRPELYDSNGVSAVVAYSETGLRLVKDNKYIKRQEVEYSDILNNNLSLEKSSLKPVSYEAFWNVYISDGWRGCKAFLSRFKPSVFRRILRYLKLKK